MDVPSMHDHPQPTPTNNPASGHQSITVDPSDHDHQPEQPEQATKTADPTIDSSSQAIIQHPSTPPPLPPSSSSSTTPTRATDAQTNTGQSHPSHPVSLDQEIQDLKKTLGGVGASLGGWWGKLQKQSVEALTTSNLTVQINTARKDLASLNLIEKAKKEVERLGEHAKEGYTFISNEIENVPDPGSNEGRIVNVDGVELPAPSRSISTSSTITPTIEDQAPISPKGKQRAQDQHQADVQSSSTQEPRSSFDSSSLGSFLTRLTKDGESLTATLQSKISHLPNQVGLAGGTKFDLSQVQKLAEGYLAKGEVYLQDVGKELKEFVQDAVKVIPPSDQDGQSIDNPDELNQTSFSTSVAEKRRISNLKRESMISNLRRDPTLILSDPRSEDSNLQNAFDSFLSSIEQAGGLQGEAWKKQIDVELECEEPDRSALKSLLEQLVPSSLTSETFWARYFFRIHRIDQEEAARRVVLSAAQEDNDGDFSWDMEDESEPASPIVLVNPSKRLVVNESTGGSSEIDKEDQVETPKLSQLSQLKMPSSSSSSSSKDEAKGTEESGIPKSSNQTASNTSQLSRRNSSSEGDTIDSFDVVSVQQSSDEKPNESVIGKDSKDSNLTSENKDKGNKNKDRPVENVDDEDDSDWE